MGGLTHHFLAVMILYQAPVVCISVSECCFVLFARNAQSSATDWLKTQSPWWGTAVGYSYSSMLGLQLSRTLLRCAASLCKAPQTVVR